MSATRLREAVRMTGRAPGAYGGPKLRCGTEAAPTPRRVVASLVGPAAAASTVVVLRVVKG